jgi:hypothetical protein
MALPEGTSVTVDGVTGKLTIKPYPENFEKYYKSSYDYIMWRFLMMKTTVKKES